MLKSVMGLALLLFSVAAQAGMGVMVENPWIREAPPTAKAMAGYMVVRNHGSQGRALVAAECPAFGEVMLHRTIMEGGMAKMVHQMKIEIPAGGAVTFEPNGYHIMLMQPKHALRAGDEVPVTLKFADGETMALSFPVKAGGMGGMDHSGMDHSAMDHGSMQHMSH